MEGLSRTAISTLGRWFRKAREGILRKALGLSGPQFPFLKTSPEVGWCVMVTCGEKPSAQGLGRESQMRGTTHGGVLQFLIM